VDEAGKLSGPERLAVVVSQLEPGLARRFLANLDSPTRDAVYGALDRVDKIPPEVVLAVVQAFLAEVALLRAG